MFQIANIKFPLKGTDFLFYFQYTCKQPKVYMYNTYYFIKAKTVPNNSQSMTYDTLFKIQKLRSLENKSMKIQHVLSLEA